jgi:U2 small nuclear ribonucleoprotein A'
VRFLDYRKVKDVEREKAKELFGTAAEPSALASKVSFPLFKGSKNMILI